MALEPRPSIDLNADVGEGFGVWWAPDDALLGHVSSASVACGFHAGDARIMRRTCAAAAAAGTRIGAHVGYQDLAGFGRRELGIAPDRLADDVVYQLGALAACARAEGAAVRYVKPHGALYHRCGRDEAAASAVAAAVRAVDPGLGMMGPPGSALLAAATGAGLATLAEGFADRRYAPDGTLVSRSETGAVLSRDEAVRQALSIALEGRAHAAGGEAVAVRVASLCVHGDTPGAAETAAALRAALEAAGVRVQPPA